MGSPSLSFLYLHDFEGNADISVAIKSGSTVCTVFIISPVVVYCLLFTVYCLLFTVYCLLFTVYCLLFM